MNKRIGRYLLIREIGSGGMATVYLARQVDLDRPVALKELGAVQLSDPASAQRFLRESRLAGSLTHPNIVTVHDYFEVRGTPYIAMEYVPRGSLRAYIGRTSLAQVGGVMAGVLAGLAHAERRGVVHRDLKPENLLVTDAGQMKIADFGIAKVARSLGTQARLTATGTTIGTPSYMAPEQALGREVGPWSDLYSVGIIAYEMLAGTVPFGDDDAPLAVLMRQVKERVPPLRKVRPDVDAVISEWVDQLLVKDPRKRTRSAVTAWRDLEEALIAVLGPRWHHNAGLADGVDYTLPAFETPHAAPPRARRTASTSRQGSARTVPPRSTPPAPSPLPRDGGRRGGRSWRVAAPLLLLLVLAGAVLGLARTGSEGGSASGQDAAAVTPTGTLSLAVPQGWKPLRAAPDTGLPLNGAVALAPEDRADGRAVVVGLMSPASAGNSALLPPAFLASLGRPASEPPARAEITLSGQALPAWRYRNLRPLGSPRALTTYVVPTDAGVATVACLARPGSGKPDAGTCDAIASTLQLRDAKPFPTGPSDAYASALTDTLGALRRAVDEHTQALAVARTKSARSRAATTLARDYDRAARRFAALRLSPADHDVNARLVSALRRADRAYAGAARAARRDAAAFERARSAAVRADGTIDEALAAARAAGYLAKTSGRQTPKTDAGSGDAPATTSPKSPAPRQTCSAEDSEGMSDDPSDDAGGCDEA